MSKTSMTFARTASQVQAKNRVRFTRYVHTGEAWHAEGEFAEASKIYETPIDEVRRFLTLSVAMVDAT